MIPLAASKQAPDIRPCSRSSGRGASPSLPSGSEPITLKYLKLMSLHFEFPLNSLLQLHLWLVWRTTNLNIMIAMSEFLEKSSMISSAIFLAFPYGLIGIWNKTKQKKKLLMKCWDHHNRGELEEIKREWRIGSFKIKNEIWREFGTKISLARFLLWSAFSSVLRKSHKC